MLHCFHTKLLPHHHWWNPSWQQWQMLVCTCGHQPHWPFCASTPMYTHVAIATSSSSWYSLVVEKGTDSWKMRIKLIRGYIFLSRAKHNILFTDLQISYLSIGHQIIYNQLSFNFKADISILINKIRQTNRIITYLNMTERSLIVKR